MSRSKSSIKPWFEDAVRQELEGYGLFWSFKNEENQVDFIGEHEAIIGGTFTCANKKCKNKSWPSGTVGITIRRYKDDQYDTIIWHQECKRCKKFGTPTINEAKYVKRVTDRIKAWEGVPIERPVWIIGDTTRGPHRADRCAGCRVGRCAAARAAAGGSANASAANDLAIYMASLNMN